MTGFVHGRKKPLSAASSIAHSNLASGRLDVRTMVADELADTSSGPDRTAVSGAGPMRHTKTAGVGSTLPTPSTARTRSSWIPGSRSVNSVNSPQPENATPSSEHSKSRSGSFPEKVKKAIGFVVRVGGWESIRVSGARSTDHWNVAPPWAEKNVKVADVDELGSVGATMISVSGSFMPSGRATVHSKAAGGCSRCRNLLVDCTSKVWSPSVTCVIVVGDVHGSGSAPS